MSVLHVCMWRCTRQSVHAWTPQVDAKCLLLLSIWASEIVSLSGPGVHGSWQVPEICLCIHPSGSGVPAMCLTWLLQKYQGYKLRSSCLCRKHFTTETPAPGLFSSQEHWPTAPFSAFTLWLTTVGNDSSRDLMPYFGFCRNYTCTLCTDIYASKPPIHIIKSTEIFKRNQFLLHEVL